jgi:outer membrane protein OmpA-like peptidoglycan-associated protein
MEVFAEVLKTRRGSGKTVRIEVHADTSGAAAATVTLPQRRAVAVKNHLVELGADPVMLVPVGVVATVPKNEKDPFAAENWRVEIGRATPPP